MPFVISARAGLSITFCNFKLMSKEKLIEKTIEALQKLPTDKVAESSLIPFSSKMKTSK
jgi:hypothetical protein